MDPSIMKLLEEDEDETMHSGADVEAFTAALNRDIEGDNSSSQLPDSDAVLSQGSNHTSSQLFSQWQTSSQDESTNSQNPHDLKNLQPQEQSAPEMDPKQLESGAENQQQQIESSQELNRLPVQQKQSQDDRQEQHTEQVTCQYSQSTGVQISEKNSMQSTTGMQQKQSQDNCQQRQEQKPVQFSQATGMQISEKNPVLIREPSRIYNSDTESQYSKFPKMNNQLATSAAQASNLMNRSSKQVPFALLLPVILPQLDKDRAMQLQTLYAKLKKNEIPKDGFVRHMRGIVGDQMLKMAVSKLQGQSRPTNYQLQPQPSAQQQHLKMSSSSAQQFTDPHSFAQPNQKGHGSPADASHIASSAAQMQADSSNNNAENSAKKSREMEHRSDSQGMQASQVSSSSLSAVSQERERSTIPIQGLNKQQQQHLHFSQTSFSMFGSAGANYRPYSGANGNHPVSSLKPQSHDSQIRQLPLNQNMGPTPLGGATQGMAVTSVPKFERQNSITDPKRVQGGSLTHLTNNSTLQQNSVPWRPSTCADQNSGPFSTMAYVKQEPVEQANEQQQKSQLSVSQGPSSFSAVQVEQGNVIAGTLRDESLEKHSSRMDFSSSTSMMPSSSVSTSMTSQVEPNVPLNPRVVPTTSPAGINTRTPPKKPSIGQKKPLEALGSSPPLSSKKQKVSGAFSDQSIEQLNDVTAVSGVNLREEEEQLLSGPKEDSRASEASRKVVQEEEERLILQRIPLKKKLAQIMARCGVMSVSNDAERCLSLCVEERLRGLISNLIRLSKQRVDSEKPRHRTFITSDVRQQILLMNRKSREEWEKKQAEAEKLRKLNEPDDSTGADGDKEKDEGRVKSIKPNKEEDDKMRTTAANVAARAAVGGDDMLSKWQLMAEQARQKREGGIDAASGSQAGKDLSHKPLSTAGRNASDNQEAEKRGLSSVVGAGRKLGRNQPGTTQTRVARSISVKDVIAALEREPQMSKSTLMYRLYEKAHADAAAE
ncbi:transcription initiation factor TFIID subunit 4b isoform X2 [Malania oleifera]|uniref:transcription initiation factor TFIID subunit 4b isoform X2 n=1 Tax=Malania oleifera TaxID=397392 RepID=UPI0025AE6C5D|nr:transcription initiation factor TFIID subunit 4b isoform X2 [Malania oleifera]XP_057973428.1 transcription initiation factor TFIID subunit 4b isoform X2 [Malania oleifera]XP_057973429.1 transcription initiation factor TFIID subunit 4b isoform X2 [Malania oleifera]XP_057973430.1 transcription initiation factor TFIID subunit 4b isoform X2 [Malania oleifera]